MRTSCVCVYVCVSRFGLLASMWWHDCRPSLIASDDQASNTASSASDWGQQLFQHVYIIHGSTMIVDLPLRSLWGYTGSLFWFAGVEDAASGIICTSETRFHNYLAVLCCSLEQPTCTLSCALLQAWYHWRFSWDETYYHLSGLTESVRNQHNSY